MLHTQNYAARKYGLIKLMMQVENSAVDDVDVDNVLMAAEADASDDGAVEAENYEHQRLMQTK